MDAGSTAIFTLYTLAPFQLPTGIFCAGPHPTCQAPTQQAS
jgi:hypothetical protein